MPSEEQLHHMNYPATLHAIRKTPDQYLGYLEGYCYVTDSSEAYSLHYFVTSVTAMQCHANNWHSTSSFSTEVHVPVFIVFPVQWWLSRLADDAVINIHKPILEKCHTGTPIKTNQSHHVMQLEDMSRNSMLYHAISWCHVKVYHDMLHCRILCNVASCHTTNTSWWSFKDLLCCLCDHLTGGTQCVEWVLATASSNDTSLSSTLKIKKNDVLLIFLLN